jgi:hypothetical protein
MKKFIFGLLLTLVSAGVLAQPYGHGPRHNRYYGHSHHNNWIAPMMLGGVVTYVLTRPEPVVVQQPVIVQSVPVNSGVVYIDGFMYTKQTMIINGIAQEVLVRQ